jgi:hypothetical protein
MSRGIWGSIMVFSLLMTGAAGWFTYETLQKNNTKEVALTAVTPSPTAKVEQTVPSPVSSPTAVEAAKEVKKEVELEPMATPSPAKKLVSKKKGKSSSKSIGAVLTYSGKGTSVYVVGDFNKWYRQPLKKGKDGWTITLKLKPGSYEYKFVVDGHHIKDPANTEEKGGNSVLIVKSTK